MAEAIRKEATVFVVAVAAVADAITIRAATIPGLKARRAAAIFSR